MSEIFAFSYPLSAKQPSAASRMRSRVALLRACRTGSDHLSVGFALRALAEGEGIG
jgi:hypothetical protein